MRVWFMETADTLKVDVAGEVEMDIFLKVGNGYVVMLDVRRLLMRYDLDMMGRKRDGCHGDRNYISLGNV